MVIHVPERTRVAEVIILHLPFFFAYQPTDQQALIDKQHSPQSKLFLITEITSVHDKQQR